MSLMLLLMKCEKSLGKYVRMIRGKGMVIRAGNRFAMPVLYYVINLDYTTMDHRRNTAHFESRTSDGGAWQPWWIKTGEKKQRQQRRLAGSENPQYLHIRYD
jgi:hypothetical protein